jgi:uncharacterized protein
MKGWFILTGLLTIATLRSSVAFFGLFFNLALTLLILAIGFYNNKNVHCIKAGGYVGLITAAFGWYNGVSLIWNKENSWITLPEGKFPWAKEGHYRAGHGERDSEFEAQ